jgi:putative chitinase
MTATASVLANKLNLRDQPQTGSVIAVLPRGQVLEIVPNSNGNTAPQGWVRVKTTINLNDCEGWVADAYVARDDAAPQSDSAFDGTSVVTVEKLRRLTPTARADVLAAVATGFGVVAPGFRLADSPLRICHFLAQAAHESMGFSRLRELGGPSYFARYEGRTDLGNVQPGDGIKFHGRGIFQLTGRANYAKMSARVGADLVAKPDTAMEPSMSFRIACIFWSDHDLNALADADDITRITHRINGGELGLAERKRLYARARTIWG